MTTLHPKQHTTEAAASQTPGPQAMEGAPTHTTAPTWPPTCRTCKFYDPKPSICRVDSPQLTAGAPSTAAVNPGITVFPPSKSFWPPVLPDEDWCGQYIAAG